MWKLDLALTRVLSATEKLIYFLEISITVFYILMCIFFPLSHHSQIYHVSIQNMTSMHASEYEKYQEKYKSDDVSEEH